MPLRQTLSVPGRRLPKANAGRSRLRRPSCWTCFLLAAVSVLSGCARRSRAPAIEFTQVPVADLGGPLQTDFMSGRVRNAKPGQKVVLYAKSNFWWVQPTTLDPFTEIQNNGTWKNNIHLGTDYAALLVDPRYRPSPRISALPPVGNGVVAIASTPGRARAIAAIASRLVHFRGYDSWWFRTCVLLLAVLATVAIYRLRIYQLTQQLNARFEERLAERTRIAQELHDTLLQGFLSASMQVDVAEDRLPDDSPAKPLLRRALQLMAEVTEESRHVIRGLRVPGDSNNDIEAVFSRLGRDLAIEDQTRYRVVRQGGARALRPAIREEVYRIGREALVNAFKHSQAASVEVEIEYAAGAFRLVVRDDGRGIDAAVLDTGRQNHWGLPGMRQRAESIGARLKLRSRIGAGTEVELTVPGSIAFADASRPRTSPLGRSPRSEKVDDPDNRT